MKMKGLVISVVIFSVIAAVLGSNEYHCYDGVTCAGQFDYKESDCSAKWGAFGNPENTDMIREAKELIAQQLEYSFEYLLIASHFKQWRENRPGFAKYFIKLSDENWDEALSLVTHMVERGSKLDKDFTVDMSKSQIDETQLYPFQALTKALDKERVTATKTLHVAHMALHGKVTHDTTLSTANRVKGVAHDVEFADFLAEKLYKHSVLRIKHLANNVRLLGDIVKSADPAYALFKFDSEWLI